MTWWTPRAAAVKINKLSLSDIVLFIFLIAFITRSLGTNRLRLYSVVKARKTSPEFERLSTFELKIKKWDWKPEAAFVLRWIRKTMSYDLTCWWLETDETRVWIRCNKVPNDLFQYTTTSIHCSLIWKDSVQINQSENLNMYEISEALVSDITGGKVWHAIKVNLFRSFFFQ